MSANAILRIEPNRFYLPFGVSTVFGLLAMYWLTFAVFGHVQALQIPLGTVLVLFAPGFLVLRLVDATPDRLGVFAMAVLGSSVTVASLSAVTTATILTQLGVDRPISFLPLAVTFSAIVLALLALVYLRRGVPPRVSFDLPRDVHWHLLLFTIPLVGVLAAGSLRWFDSTLGSVLFVGALAVGVLAFTHVRGLERTYPLAVFTIALSLLLHRNFASPHVIGADVQSFYAVADHVFTTGSWVPELAGIGDSIPIMTIVPAAIATLLDAPLLLTFKLLFVLMFACVPLGIYYLAEDLFDPTIALFGALFFAFYHLSILFTPGKQLVAELFAVLVLLSLALDSDRRVQPVLLAVFSTGLVLSHYGLTYVLGISLLVASILLAIVRYVRPGIDGHISPVYPIALLGSATGWYALTSPDLVARIAGIPGGLLAQASVVLSGGSVERSGATQISADTTLIGTLNVLLYVVLLGLIAVGLSWLVFHVLTGGTRRQRLEIPEYTALAVPICLLLAASYVFVLDLWADRVFQLGLVVLAPLIPLGYRLLSSGLARLMPAQPLSLGRTPLAVLLVTVLLFSSGFVVAVDGDSDVSTFNQNANDLSFDEADLAAIQWLQSNTDVARAENPTAFDDAPLFVDSPERVQIYTDPTTHHLLRSTLSSRYYTTETVVLKNQWRPTISLSEIGAGYVLLREEAIVDTQVSNAVLPTRVTTSEASTLRDLGTVVYDRRGIQIVEIPSGDR